MPPKKTVEAEKKFIVEFNNHTSALEARLTAKFEKMMQEQECHNRYLEIARNTNLPSTSSHASSLSIIDDPSSTSMQQAADTTDDIQVSEKQGTGKTYVSLGQIHTTIPSSSTTDVQ